MIGDLIKIKPLISIIEIFAVYYVAKETIKFKENNTVFFSIILSIILGIILMFLSFYKGINLNDFAGDNQVLINDALEIDLQNYRMSYFYTSFPFLISSLVFILIYYIDKVNKIISKTFIILLILFICLSLVASGNKTVMFTTLIIFLLSNFIFNGKSVYKNRNIFLLIFILPLLGLIIANTLLNEYNTVLFTERMLSLDSFEDRIGVYTNVFYLLSENILRYLTGYGADFLTAAGNPLISYKFKTNHYTKAEQGAVDSGIISFIIEFGILYFFLFTYIIVKRLRFLFSNFDSYNIMYIQIFLIFIISSCTQLLGLSKIFWFFVLIYVFSKYRLTQANLSGDKSINITI